MTGDDHLTTRSTAPCVKALLPQSATSTSSIISGHNPGPRPSPRHIPSSLPFSASRPAPDLVAATIRRGDEAAPDIVHQQASRLVKEWGHEISRYGLTSSTLARDKIQFARPPPLGDSERSLDVTSSSPSSARLPAARTPDPTGALHGKRASEDDLRNGPHRDISPPKRARISPPRDLDLTGFADSWHQHKREDITSPLFFSSGSSRHPTPRPLILSSSSSDTVGTMLSRLREDIESVTTIQLPRGNVSSISPPMRPDSTPGSLPSLDGNSSSMSPEGRALPAALQSVNQLGVVDLLEQDDRPTFVIDLANPANPTRLGVPVLYANASLRAAHGIMEMLLPETEHPATRPEFVGFKAWAVNPVPSPESSTLVARSMQFGGISWTASTLRRRFRFISGDRPATAKSSTSVSPMAQEAEIHEQRSRGPTPLDHPDARNTGSADPDYFGNVGLRTGDLQQALDSRMDIDQQGEGSESARELLETPMVRQSFDWTRIPVSASMSEHIRFARSVDWASTSLGPIEQWGADLRMMSSLIMGSPHPTAMYWGPDYVIIYNAAYVDLAGKKHPKLMGMKYSEAWSEIWSEIEPVFRDAFFHGQSTMRQEHQMFINRHGFVEECFFSWSIVPVVGGDGNVVGLYNPAFEDTRRKVTERRMFILRDVGEKTGLATSVEGFWPQVKKGLEYDLTDVPFALIYSVRDDNNESEISSMQSGSISHPPRVVLEGSIGVPEGHPAAATDLDLRTSEVGFAPYMRESLANAGVPIVLTQETLTQEVRFLPPELIKGLEWQGFGDPCRTVVVFTVQPTTGENVVGFVVLGVNPRHGYDDDYKLFIDLLNRQLATSMASVVLFEEEIKRGQRAARLATLNQQELSKQLILKTQEVEESELKFTRMGEYAPVGMFIADHRGVISYCNDMFWQISRHPRFEDNLYSWMDSVRVEDRQGLEDAWQHLIQHKEPLTHEFRFKYSQQRGEHIIDTWVLLSASPDKDSSGNLRSIFACITDISSQKWAEDVQNQRREEAVELKRQQENFIDITSHEMRNPLSAVLQLADEINNSISEFRSNNSPSEEIDVLLDNCVDAANTINLCASHQKRIVDDVLTLSKLDSQLLLVTPVDVQPLVEIQLYLKMFEKELISNGIQLEFKIDPSYTEHNITWLKLDPSRLRQVLINLMTNAIKFTQNREEKRISVSIGASVSLEQSRRQGINFFPNDREDKADVTSGKDWGTGEEVNLHFTVSDTGPGLAEDETKMLFQRFSQASPRTHVKYGGSGLGLFICRILTELQGGQIGVTSRKGVGSTFNFYIKARRSLNPPSPASTTTAAPGTPIMTLTAPPNAKTGTGSSSSLAAAAAAVAGTTTLQQQPLDQQPDTLQRRKSMRRQQDSGRPPLDILIVEDNLVNQRVLQKQLLNAGNNTQVANHGGEALDTLTRSRFWAGREADGTNVSVILMDLEMPVMDGITCVKKIRELEGEGVIVAHIPIIAVTAYARKEQVESAKAAGIDDVISKPFRIPELIPKIDELVAKYNTLSTS